MQTHRTRRHHGVAAFHTATSKTRWLGRTVLPSPSSPTPALGLDAATAAATAAPLPGAQPRRSRRLPRSPLSRGRLLWPRWCRCRCPTATGGAGEAAPAPWARAGRVPAWGQAQRGRGLLAPGMHSQESNFHAMVMPPISESLNRRRKVPSGLLMSRSCACCLLTKPRMALGRAGVSGLGARGRAARGRAALTHRSSVASDASSAPP